MDIEAGCYRFDPYDQEDRAILARCQYNLNDEEKASMLALKVRDAFRRRLDYYLRQVEDNPDITFGGFVITIPETPFVEDVLAAHE